MGLPWEKLLGDCDRRLRGSAIRDLLAVTAQPHMISFAGGLPAPELFPVEELRASFDAVLRTDGAGALQYGPTEGHRPLRAYLAERLRTRGIVATPEEILLTTGSQQGLDLLGKVLLRPGAQAIVEAPSYVGALQAFGAREPRYTPVAMDEQGLRVDEVERALDGTAPEGAALLYTVATFQNPSGVTMSPPRRAALLALCQARELPLIEDDPYGELRYEGDEVPPLRALPGGEETIYLGTFSKILVPGLRLGWIVAPRPLIARLIIAKQGTDLHTDSLAQRAVLHYCTHADLAGHIARLRTFYRTRRDAMMAALARHFPAGVRWTRPQGGLFTWVTLPAGTDSTAVLVDAVARGVAFVPGAAFYVDGGGAHCLRLNFSRTAPEVIDEGVQRLSAVVTAHIPRAHQGRGASAAQPQHDHQRPRAAARYTTARLT
jgi:2-aminoadipate transaminase